MRILFPSLAPCPGTQRRALFPVCAALLLGLSALMPASHASAAAVASHPAVVIVIAQTDADGGAESPASDESDGSAVPTMVPVDQIAGKVFTTNNAPTITDSDNGSSDPSPTTPEPPPPPGIILPLVPSQR